VTDIGQDQQSPSIALDSSNNAHVVWLGKGWGTYTANNNVQYRKRNSTGTGMRWKECQTLIMISIVLPWPWIQLDHVHVGWGGYGWGHYPAFFNLEYRQRAGSVWQTEVGITDSNTSSAGAPVLIWANNPKLGSSHTNRPKTGYALICSASTPGYQYLVLYYPSPDLSWDAAPAEPPPSAPIATALSSFSIAGVWGSVNSDKGYVLELSTGAFPNSFSGNQSSATSSGTSISLTIAGLTAVTMYYLRWGASGTTGRRAIRLYRLTRR